MFKDNLELEKERLENISIDFSMKTGFNGRLEKYRSLTMKENIHGDNILDVACADGFMAQELSKYFKHITAIDGSEKLINEAKKLNLKNVDFVCTLFEEYNPEKKFDSILLCDILEHVNNPLDLLEKSSEWVKDDGVILILCPNANSIHRQIGVLAGMMKDIHELNETDKRVGHRRVYDIELLKKDINASNLKIIKWGGVFLKPLSNNQMDQLDNKVVDAFYSIGKNLPPELLTEIYVKCEK
ncbi:MAG: class I SAM-dependent methyltransferase [Elusimicrobia bacterium]|nr:class I SAM-dependent methyltransferase [Elusimicrobiota bacterium]